MSSNINFLAINENFPVAGQDNDTQVFRDNFNTIKTNFQTAQTEISDLQDNTARLDQGNDYSLNEISRAVMINNTEKTLNAGTVDQSTTIDYENGSYQIFRLEANINMDFLNFPGDPQLNDGISTGVGKVTLELYSDGDPRTISFITSNGAVIKKDPDFPAVLTISSSENPTFIEIWRREQGKIFMRYLGTYS